MANLSQEKRKRMLEFLQQIRAEHTDDTSIIAINEIESELTSKKYGLVWEEHTEEVDEQIKHNVPVFTEVSDKIITTDENLPYNFLLEGDNLHSLKLLEKTHKGKIDVIYIDPPYNTGNKDFIYSDKMIGLDDGFRHSKWLSFMKTRLDLAKVLLSEQGLIFISIDDNEVAQLKLLCDEIFGFGNFRGQIVRATGTPTGQGNAILSNEFDYILVYSKTDKAIFNGVPFDEEDEKIYNLQDEYGKYLLRPLRKTGGEDRREDRPSMFYPVISPDGTEVYPIAPSGYESRWRCQKSTYENLLSEHRIEWKKDKNGWKVYQKFYLEGRLKQPSNLWVGIEGNKKATITLKNILGVNDFSFPKPVELISRVLQISSQKNSIVLDFFAGSGTTAQAVMELNKQDGGNRRFILCTNNENGICENITYQRIKTVITGKRADGTEYGEGIPANLKYFKTDYIAKTSEDEEYSVGDKLLGHIAEMVELQHGTKIDNEKHILVLTDEMADGLTEEKLADCEQLYVSVSVLLTTEQERMFKKMGIEVLTIPDYYFESELLEVGER